MPQKYKTIRHYHEPGDFHELTFSCYQRRPLLTNDAWLSQLARAIDRACEGHHFRLHAFVFMPEHVHLLTYPTQMPDVDNLLQAVKRPFSYRIKQQLLAAESPLVKTLTVRERPGKTAFRFWQEGPGYDRNMQSADAVLAALQYIHFNPVKRGLCERMEDWKWSSARFYRAEGQVQDADLPKIHPLPAELLTTTT